MAAKQIIKKDAAESYAEAVFQALSLADEITAAIQDDMDAVTPETATWGHVGSMSHAVELLQQTLSFLRGDEH